MGWIFGKKKKAEPEEPQPAGPPQPQILFSGDGIPTQPNVFNRAPGEGMAKPLTAENFDGQSAVEELESGYVSAPTLMDPALGGQVLHRAPPTPGAPPPPPGSAAPWAEAQVGQPPSAVNLSPGMLVGQAPPKKKPVPKTIVMDLPPKVKKKPVPKTVVMDAASAGIATAAAGKKRPVAKTIVMTPDAVPMPPPIAKKKPVPKTIVMDPSSAAAPPPPPLKKKPVPKTQLFDPSSAGAPPPPPPPAQKRPVPKTQLFDPSAAGAPPPAPPPVKKKPVPKTMLFDAGAAAAPPPPPPPPAKKPVPKTQLFDPSAAMAPPPPPPPPAKKPVPKTVLFDAGAPPSSTPPPPAPPVKKKPVPKTQLFDPSAAMAPPPAARVPVPKTPLFDAAAATPPPPGLPPARPAPPPPAPPPPAPSLPKRVEFDTGQLSQADQKTQAARPVAPITGRVGPVTARAPAARPPAALPSAAPSAADARQKTMRLSAEDRERPSARVPAPLSDKQKQLAASLLSAGVVTQEFLSAQLKKAGRQAGALGKALLQSGYVKEDDILAILVRQHKIPSIKIAKTKIPLDTVATLPEEVARKHKAIVLERLDDLLVVVTTQLFNGDAIAALRKETGCKIAMIACKDAPAFEAALDDFYGRLRKSSQLTKPAPADGTATPALRAVAVRERVRPAKTCVPDLGAQYDSLFASAGPVRAAARF